MHVPAELRARVLQAAVSALRPGGVLLFEGYTPRQLGRDSGGPPSVELLMEPEELQGLRLEILRECLRPIREGLYHQGDSAVVQVLCRKS